MRTLSIIIFILILIFPTVSYCDPLYNMRDHLKDTITGFTGDVTGIVEYINNTYRYRLQPRELADGKPIEGQWFYEETLVLEQLITEVTTGVTTGEN